MTSVKWVAFPLAIVLALVISFNLFFDFMLLHNVNNRHSRTKSLKKTGQDFVVRKSSLEQHPLPAVEEETIARLNRLQQQFDQNKELLRQQREQRERSQLNHKSSFSTGESQVLVARERPSTDIPGTSGLKCQAYGGPSDEFYHKEMVYWQNIYSDSQYTSPFYNNDNRTRSQYLIVETERASFNTMRMAFEVAAVLAHAMGRTLVLMPEHRYRAVFKDYSERWKQKTEFLFSDFFSLDSLQNHVSGLRVISMEEFLLKEAMGGNLINTTTGIVTYPPFNRTDWNGAAEMRPLIEYLRSVSYRINWKPGTCMATFGPQTVLQELREAINRTDFPGPPSDIPVPVNAPPLERLRENLGHRKELCIYSHEQQSARVLHLWYEPKVLARHLTHFYTFLFFVSWEDDLFYKRFVRDHFRYTDEVQCAAARVISAIRERARKRHRNANPTGQFYSFHIRRGDYHFKEKNTFFDERGDFHYQRKVVGIHKIYLTCKNQIAKDATVFIATDETSKDIFQPLVDNFDVVILDDFKHLFTGLNPKYYGMLNQLIASKGRLFFGTYPSTFSGYINRLRGYHSSKIKSSGYKMGIIKSWYHSPSKRKNEMRVFRSPGMSTSHVSREFPAVWREINEGINELQKKSSGHLL